MNKRTAVSLAIALLVLLTSGCRSLTPEEAPGYIIYQAVDEEGEPLPKVVVLDGTGDEQRRIALPDGVATLYPYHGQAFGSRVLYGDPIATRGWYLVDAASGEVQAFDTLGGDQDPARPCAAGARHVLLCGEGSLYLLDVSAGEVIDLPVDLDTSSPTPSFVEVAGADRSHFFVRHGGDLWFVPANDPQAARRLGDGAVQAALAADGAFVLYAERKEGETTVVRESIDGADRQVLLSGPDIVSAVPVPQHPQLILVRRDAVSLYDLDEGQEQTLFEPEDIVGQIWVDPQGNKAAFAGRGVTTQEVPWTYADLQAGTVEDLDALQGYARAYGGAASRWIYAADDPNRTEKVRIASLDLEQGAVRQHLTLESTGRLDLAGSTDDGSVGLLSAFFEGGEIQYWLLVAGQKKARLLSTGRIGLASAALSPDGAWVVLGEKRDVGEAMVIERLSTANGKAREMGQGLMPVWASP